MRLFGTGIKCNAKESAQKKPCLKICSQASRPRRLAKGTNIQCLLQYKYIYCICVSLEGNTRCIESGAGGCDVSKGSIHCSII